MIPREMEDDLTPGTDRASHQHHPLPPGNPDATHLPFPHRPLSAPLHELTAHAIEANASGQFDRRGFLGLMAASTALAGLQGCRRPDIEILPYAHMPEFVIPGMPLFYATSLLSTHGVRPVLVETHEGRPTKIEGNPQHPFSQGASDLLTQASILELYDPDRSRTVRHEGKQSSWESFDVFASSNFKELLVEQGAGLSMLSDLHALRNIPALRMLREHLNEVAPKATWHAYSPAADSQQAAATELLFGRRLRVDYRLERAQVIVALDADFFGPAESQAVPNTRAFVAGRQPSASVPKMNRLYVVEPSMTVTGGMADHRLRISRSDILDFVIALAGAVGVEDQLLQASANSSVVEKRTAPRFSPAWIKELASDLRDHAGSGLVFAGLAQPPAVHAITYLINEALGNLHTTITFEPSTEPEVSDLQELVDRMDAKSVQTLLILEGNPAYDAPVDLEFAKRLEQVPNTIRFGLFEDETSQRCRWHLPAAHSYESWADAESPDGVYSAVQPMIAPLFGGRSLLEMLSKFIQFDRTEPYEIAQASFAKQTNGMPSAPSFEKFLHEGFLLDVDQAGDDLREPIKIDREQIAAQLPEMMAAEASSNLADDQLELAFHLDASVFDGRFANNGWLQEVPDPVTKLAWDNGALISPTSATRLGLSSGDIVALRIGERSLEIPVWVAAGQADRTISIALGYGRTHAGRVGSGVGFNAYTLRTSQTPFVARGVQVETTGRVHKFACTQEHSAMEGRDLAHSYPLAEFLGLSETSSHGTDHDHSAASAEGPSKGSDGNHHKGNEGGNEGHHVELPLIQSPELTGTHQWGMTIDLNRCVGCNACMVACQSENNIPIVGKKEVAIGRSMHWIRVDRYFEGDESDPTVMHQPVACVHCENAPCETVCPVNAAVHSPEGLNLQVYNRCVGTRYCSNNCPYKVRRFNWFDYQQRPLDQLRWGPLTEKGSPETLKMQKNPDVTVRMRGIMEKCTYCVQRIERAKTGVKLQDPTSQQARVPDGTITPACAQACPAQAIVFGDIADADSEVSRLKRDARHFGLLAELGTKPRTSYLARIRNPNPRLQRALSGEGNQPT